MVDTAQSLAAQQFYLGLVYQSVNQFSDPARQSPMGRSPQSYSPAPPPPQQPQIQHTPPIQPVQQLMPPQPSPQQMQPQPPRMPMPVMTPEPPMCRTMLPGNQMCRNPVNKPGEKCPAHQPPKEMSDFAKGPPPVSFLSCACYSYWLISLFRVSKLSTRITSVPTVINWKQQSPCSVRLKSMSLTISPSSNAPNVLESITLCAPIWRHHSK